MRCILTHSRYNFRNFGMVGFHSAIWYKTILESRYNCLPYASSGCIFCTPVGSPCLIKLNLIRQSSDAAAKANKHVPSVSRLMFIDLTLVNYCLVKVWSKLYTRKSIPMLDLDIYQKKLIPFARVLSIVLPVYSPFVV